MGATALPRNVAFCFARYTHLGNSSRVGRRVWELTSWRPNCENLE